MHLQHNSGLNVNVSYMSNYFRQDKSVNEGVTVEKMTGKIFKLALNCSGMTDNRSSNVWPVDSVLARIFCYGGGVVF